MQKVIIKNSQQSKYLTLESALGTFIDIFIQLNRQQVNHTFLSVVPSSLLLT
jgi:hypothetical protein